VVVPIREQIRSNAVALISLVVALSSLGYNTWRNETTESQRNIRHASFRVLENLGSLQEVVDYRYYYLPFETETANEGELRLRGYGSVTLIRDLMNLMPEPAPAAGRELHQLWNEHVNALARLNADNQHTTAAGKAENELSRAIEDTRMTIVAVLKSLE
jgi:hypothetical protein